MDDAKRIARQLTETQRLWMAEPDNDADLWCPDGRVLSALERKGLVKPGYRPTREYTPLGEAVRAELERQSNGK